MNDALPAAFHSTEDAPTGDSASNLWAVWMQGRSPANRDQLFDHYLPLAKIIAGRLYRERMLVCDYADYYQLAAEGLLQAIDRYDPSRGVPFGGYAHRRIDGNIRSGIIKLSEAHEQIAFKQRIRRERLQAIHSTRIKTPAAPGDSFSILCDLAVGLAIGFMLDDSGLLLNGSTTDVTPNAYESMALQEVKQHMLQAVASLPPKEHRIIMLHYGDDLDFTTIAELVKLSKGRVSQIHSAALDHLRKRLKASSSRSLGPKLDNLYDRREI